MVVIVVSRYKMWKTLTRTAASAAFFSAWHKWRMSQLSGLVLAGEKTKGAAAAYTYWIVQVHDSGSRVLPFRLRTCLPP